MQINIISFYYIFIIPFCFIHYVILNVYYYVYYYFIYHGVIDKVIISHLEIQYLLFILFILHYDILLKCINNCNVTFHYNCIYRNIT